MIIEKQKRMVEETKYVIELSEADRLAVIADPSGLVRDLKRAPITADNGRVKTAVKAQRKTPLKKNTASKRGQTRDARSVTAARFQCEQCSAKFKGQGWLDRHIEREHSGDVEIGQYGANGDD
jgi:hypothetical protein